MSVRWTEEQVAAFRASHSLPEPKKKLKQIESAIQIEFIRWVREAEKVEPRLRLLFSVPNGGKRGYKTAAKMKAEGQRPGVPDIMLPVRRGDCPGLAIEFKRPDGGYASTDQKKYIGLLVEQGWKVLTLTSVQDAIAQVCAYLGIDAQKAVDS